MSVSERIRSGGSARLHVDPAQFAPGPSNGGGVVGGVNVRMTATGHLQAEDDEGNCEYKWRLTGISDERFQHLVTQMKFRVAEGHGLCLYEIGVADDGAAIGLCDGDYEESIATVVRMADALGFNVKLAFERLVDVAAMGDVLANLPDQYTARKGRGPGARVQAGHGEYGTCIRSEGSLPPHNRRRCAELHVTRCQKQVEDLRIAFCGLGGSGKSTLVGVLTQGALDDGSGSVRSTVFNHKHEVDTGCTSSVTNHVIGFDSIGRVTNYDEERLPRTPIISPTLSNGALSSARAKENDELSRSENTCFGDGDAGRVAGRYDNGTSTLDYALNATRTISERSVKLVTLLDLGGQDKYSKTAYFGITSKAPGYACIVTSADASIVSGIGLHVSICLALRIPFFVVVTKCDRVGELELDDVQLEVDDFIRGEARYMGHVIKTRTCTGYEDVLDESLINGCVDRSIVPVFLTSCVLGHGIGYVKTFFHKLPSAERCRDDGMPSEVLVDGCYHVAGVGPVLGGLITKGDVCEGQQLLMGPDRHGHFQCITVRGIHEKGSHVTRASAGTEATFGVGHIPDTMDANRKGTILLGIGTVHPNVCMSFECRVRVIDAEGSPIVAGQEPILHCRNVRQAVRLVAVARGHRLILPANELGDACSSQRLMPREEGVVLCQFLYHPEVLERGSILMLRWNRSVRVVGTVTRLVPLDPCTSPHMRPTPSDMFEEMELPSQMMLPEEVEAIKSHATTPQQRTAPNSSYPSPLSPFGGSGVIPGSAGDDCMLAAGGLFGDSDDDTERRGRVRVKRAHHIIGARRPDSPGEDNGGGNTPTCTSTSSSSEGAGAMATFGEGVGRRSHTHTAALITSHPQSIGGDSTVMLGDDVFSYPCGDTDKSPFMNAHATTEYVSDEML